jgi:predicted acyl esterase
MQIIDEAIKTRGFQAMVEMRDGTRLNTLVRPDHSTSTV